MVCPAQCGVKKWCTAFTLTPETDYGEGTKSCKMYSTCETENGVMNTDLFRLKQRLDSQEAV